MFLGIITEDEHRVLQLGIYISLKKHLLLQATKGVMGREVRDAGAARQLSKV
jgi:hypothetical protein